MPFLGHLEFLRLLNLRCAVACHCKALMTSNRRMRLYELYKTKVHIMQFILCSSFYAVHIMQCTI